MPSFTQVPVDGPELSHYLRVLNSLYVNGSVRAARFQGDLSTLVEKRFRPPPGFPYETTGFNAFLSDEVVRSVLPELLEPLPFEPGQAPEFTRESLVTLDGELARELLAGGAYENFRGPVVQAKTIAAAAVHELIQDRYDDFELYTRHDDWSAWFFGIAWDRTWILVDRARSEITMICATDTD